MEPDSLGGIHLSEVKSLSCSNVSHFDSGKPFYCLTLCHTGLIMTTAKDFECRRISVTICARKGETEIVCLRIVYANKEKSSYENL